MASRVDPDLELGGRIALQDAFSRQARSVETSFRSLHGTFTRNAGRLFQTAAALGGGFRGLAASMFGPIGIAAGLHHVARATLESASTAESTELAFTTLLRSSQAARAHLDELRQFALGKPFEFNQLAESSRMLQTFGFNVRDVTGLLTDMGNAAFVSNTGYNGVQRMVRVFGQVRATGRITFGQLGMLVRAGVPAFDILRERLNLTGEQLRNIARSGIPAERIIAALREGMNARYAGGMDRASRTVAARLSDLQDAAEYFKVLVGQGLSSRFKEILTDISSVAGNAENLRAAARRVAQGLDIILLAVRGIVSLAIGGFRDVGAAWQRHGNRTIESATRGFENLHLIVQGFSALMTGQDSRGVSRIPRALHEQLVARGLWPTMVRVAAWGARVRAVIQGFVEGAVGELRVFAARARWLGDMLGLTGGRMGSTREDARRFGQQLAHAAVVAMELRLALTLLNGTIAAVTAAQRAYGAAAGVWTFTSTRVMRLAVWISNTTVAQWALTRATLAYAAAQQRLALATAGTNRALGAQAARFGLIGALAAAAIAAAVYAYQNYDRLTAMTRSGSVGDVANASAQRGLLSALGAGAVFAIMDVVRAFQTYGPRTAAAARGLGQRAGAALVGAWRWTVGGGLSGALRAIGARMGAFFEPVLRPLKLVASAGALLAYSLTAWIALGLARAGMFVGRGMLRLGLWIGRGLAAVGGVLLAGLNLFVVRPVAWAGRMIWLGARTIVGGVATLVLGAVLGIWAGVVWIARRVAPIFSAIGRWARAAWTWVSDGAFRALVWVSNGLERAGAAIGRFAVRVRNALVRAFVAVRNAVVEAFRAVGNAVLGGLRSTAGGILDLYRALPPGLRPGALAGAEGALDRFARGGGEQPTPEAPAPGPQVPQLLAQRATAQAALAGRAGGAPPIVVQVPPAQQPPVVVQIDGREVVRAVARQAEGEQIRRGGGGAG